MTNSLSTHTELLNEPFCLTLRGQLQWTGTCLCMPMSSSSRSLKVAAPMCDDIVFSAWHLLTSQQMIAAVIIMKLSRSHTI